MRVIRIERHSKIWRAILTPGIPLGIMPAFAAGVKSVSPAPSPEIVVPVGAAVTLGPIIPAYYLGKRLDRQEWVETRIRRN